jgi:uncharacterized membrane protein
MHILKSRKTLVLEICEKDVCLKHKNVVKNQDISSRLFNKNVNWVIIKQFYYLLFAFFFIILSLIEKN